MKKELLCTLLWLILCINANSQTIFSLPESGSTTFGNWSFSWHINGHHESLVLENVRWKNTKILYKASLPVIRVKYRGEEQDVSDGCGPYQDRIGSVKTKHKIPGATSDVVSRFYNNGNLMEIAVFDVIGGYELYHAWYFHKDGWMQSILWSRGWSCGHNPPVERDHRHHPYWRLDFDVVTHNNECRIFTTQSAGISINNSVERREINWWNGSTNRTIGVRVKSSSSNKFVDVSTWGNPGPWHHSQIGSHAELRDFSGRPWFNFCYNDIGLRRYHGYEDDGWIFGELGNLGFRNGIDESIFREDVVVWTTGHMSHNWDNGADRDGLIWHGAGPVIRPSW